MAEGQLNVFAKYVTVASSLALRLLSYIFLRWVCDVALSLRRKTTPIENAADLFYRYLAMFALSLCKRKNETELTIFSLSRRYC